MPEHDCLPPDVSATEFVVHMARMSGLPPRGRPRAHRRHAAPRRAVRGALPPDRRLLDRHAAAGQARPGAGPRPAAGAARRADQRARPGRPRRHARADPPDRHRVRHLGAGHLAPARRARAGLRPRRRHRRRPAAALLVDRRRHRGRAGCSSSRSTDRADELAARAARRPGCGAAAGRPAARGRPADDATYDLVRDAVAGLGVGLVRLERRRHRMAEMFTHRRAATGERS